MGQKAIMKDLAGPEEIEGALRLVGELLEARGHRYHIAIIGGSAVNLLGLVSRATTDVDILAFAMPDAAGVLRLRPPDQPLPFNRIVSEVIEHARAHRDRSR